MKNYGFLVFIFSITLLNISAQNIHRTACNGNLQRLDSLLQANPIQVKDHQGRSLLHWVVACRQQEIFDFLIDRGIKPDAMDNKQETALHVAVRFERDTFFTQLLNLQDDKGWISNSGASLMQIAVLNRSQRYLQKLLDAGVGIDMVNERGSTPLEIAKKIGATEIAEYLIAQGADENKVRTFTMKDEYMGQEAPGMEPKVFAPNFISTEEYEFGSVFSKDKTEFYYGVDVGSRSEIRFSKLIDNQWTNPEIILSHKRYGYNDPFLSPDEDRLYFISKRALDGKGELKDFDIWYVERQEDGWSEPINAGPNINTQADEYYISFTNDGTMFYASNGKDTTQSDHDIYSSTFKAGTFQPAVSLGDAINTEHYEADVFVAPDESYLIFCSTRPDGLGRGDMYISFKNENGSWTQAVNMGAPINTVHHELCPFVTADGKYFFYTSDEDIYWVETKIFEKIRNRIRK